MKKIITFFNCAVCVLALGSTAFAGSFNPEIRSLGSMNRNQAGISGNKTVAVGNYESKVYSRMQIEKDDYLEKPVRSRGGVIRSYGWLVPEKSPNREQATVTVSISVSPVEGYEVFTAAVGLIDETTKSVAADIKQDETSNTLPTETQASLDTSHTFSAIAYGELTKDDEVKAVAYYTTVEIVEGVINLNIDFNESTRLLAYQAYMGNGQPFPEYQPWEDGCGFNINYSGQLSYSGYFANFLVNDPMTFYVHCNEFPGSSYYSISYSANLFDDQIYCNLAGGGSLSDFADPENMVECIPAEFYDNLSFTVSLSPADREIGKETLISGSKNDLAVIMENGKFGLETRTLSMCFNDATRQPVDSYEFYTWVPYSTIATNVQTSMVYTGFGAYNESSSKYCGARTRVNGIQYILPWEQNWNEEKQTYTPFSSISQFNIRPEEQDLKNFLYPLYAISSISLQIDETTGKLSGASYSSNYYGMFNEKLNFMGVDVLKSFTIDGKEKKLDDILRLPLNSDHSFDFTFYNPDGYVQGQFETEALNILHSTTSNASDMIPPKIIGLQMYDSDGKIRTSFKAGEECNLIVAMFDRTTGNNPVLDFDAKLYISPQDTEDWSEISNPDVVEYDARLGKTYEFALPTDGTLASNQWLKLKVVGKDSSGNTNTMLLDYCLYINDPDSINGINTDRVEDIPAVYFNLQGVKIANPEPGQTVICRRGARSEKLILR